MRRGEQKKTADEAAEEEGAKGHVAGRLLAQECSLFAQKAIVTPTRISRGVEKYWGRFSQSSRVGTPGRP